MPFIPSGWRLIAVVFVVSLLPGIASAQELRPSLKLPTTIAANGASPIAMNWAEAEYEIARASMPRGA